MRDKPIKDALLRVVGGIGVDIVDRTQYAELDGLIRALRPLDSGVVSVIANVSSSTIGIACPKTASSLVHYWEIL